MISLYPLSTSTRSLLNLSLSSFSFVTLSQNLHVSGDISSAKTILGFVITVAGIGMVISFYSCKNAIKKKKEAIEKMFEEKLDKGKQILRAFLAEVVDFREEFSEKDAESSKVISFLKSLKAKEYIKRSCDANRKIKI